MKVGSENERSLLAFATEMYEIAETETVQIAEKCNNLIPKIEPGILRFINLLRVVIK